MNKKLMLLPLFAVLIIGTVFALTYYGVFSTTMNVQSSITIDGDLSQELGYIYDLEPTPGTLIKVTNSAPSERSIVISDNEEDVSVSYTSTLELTQKNVDFNLDIWTPAESGLEATVTYTVVGDGFDAEVTDGAIDGYALYYYKDNSDRFNEPAEAILLSEVNENLPFETDANADENDYSAEYYGVAHGAKIWYLPTDAVIEGVITWSRASEFLFETTLIQYNVDGEITIYPGQTLELTPVYTAQQYANGTYIVTTTIL